MATEAARATTAAPASAASLEIVRAVYGPAKVTSPEPWKQRFVTRKLQSLVTKSPGGGKLLLLHTPKYNALFGDPAPDQPKILTLRFRINFGSPQERVWDENASIFLEASNSNSSSNNGSRVNSDTSRRRTRRLSSAISRRQSVETNENSEAIVGSNDPQDLFKTTTAAAAATTALLIKHRHLAGFGELPVELIREIIQFLPLVPDRYRMNLVSKAWSRSLTPGSMADALSMGSRISGDCLSDVPSSSLVKLLSSCAASLVRLDLSECAQLTDEMLSNALLEMKGGHLETLRLNGCVGLSDLGVAAIPRCTPGLHKLELKRLVSITDDVVIDVAKGCVQLIHLDVSDCRQLTDASIIAVANNLPQLRVLYLKDLHLITDEAIRQLLIHNQDKLEALSLWALHLLTSTSISYFSLSSRLSLASLNLWGCHFLRDNAVAAVCRACPHLLELRLRFCHRLTNGCLPFIATLERLEHLDIRYLYKITETGLNHLASNTKLRSLNLSQCTKLNDAAFVSLCAELPNLSELLVRANSWVTDATLKSLATMYAANKKRSTLDLVDARDCDGVSEGALDILKSICDETFVEQVHRCFSR